MSAVTDKHVNAHCGICSWTTVIVASTGRLDQAVYTTIWEHIEAAHFNDVKDLRAMPVKDRKATIMGWSDF